MDNGKVIQIGNIYPDTSTFKNRTMGRVYDIQGLAPTINTCGGGGREPKIVENMNDMRILNRAHGFNKGGVKDVAPTCTGSAYQDNNFVLEPMCSVHPNSHKFEFNPKTSIKPIAPALRATDYKAPHCAYEPMPYTDGRQYRIRKLTPRECFRLMGVDDNDIDKIQAAGISNSQQYKMAGNSIVVDVLYHLFRKMFCETANEQQQMTLF